MTDYETMVHDARTPSEDPLLEMRKHTRSKVGGKWFFRLEDDDTRAVLVETSVDDDNLEFVGRMLIRNRTRIMRVEDEDGVRLAEMKTGPEEDDD